MGSQAQERDAGMNDVALIWWTDEAAAKVVERTIISDAWPASRHDRWPVYLVRQFESRIGRAGRGRLWDSGDFGPASVDDAQFDKTPIGRWIVESSMAGIVIGRRDLSCVIDMPGVVTDLELRRVS